jgi:uncharacterized protein YjbI with pentapeptide repeats
VNDDQARHILNRLASGQGLDGLGLPSVGGRIDVRGLRTPDPMVIFRGVALARLDLGDGDLSGWRFHDSTLSDCRMDGAICRDWRLWNSRVSDCSFSGGDLEGSAVGTWHEGRGNRWQRIDFTDAGFRVGVSWVAHYEDCDFSNSDLTGVSIEQCALLRCRFRGDLHQVVFDGRAVSGRPPSPPMQQVDFSGARFDRVEFVGFTLDDVILPDDPDLRVIRRFPCAVERALGLLGPDDSEPARILRADLESRLHVLRVGSNPDDANVLNRRDYLLDGGEPLARLAFDLLTRAEAECLRAAR